MHLVRNWCKKVVILLACFLSGNIIAFAQQYYQVTGNTGTQNIGGNSVTISATGSTIRGFNGCIGVGPYTIGNSWPAPSMGQSYFSFQFAIPVTHVKVQGVYINPGELLFLKINGLPYTLSNGNLSPFTGCSDPQAIITAGGALATATGALSAQAQVIVTGCLQSLEVLTDGLLDGIIFGVHFATDVKATNSGGVCEGGTIQLNGTAAGNNAQYSWTGPDGFSSALQHPVLNQVTLAKEGIYTLSVHMCDADYMDTTYVHIRPAPQIDATYDQPLCTGGALQLRSNTVQDSVTCQWNGPGQFAATTADALVTGNATPGHEGWYRLRATRGSCTARDSVLVRVAKPVQHSFTEVVCGKEGYLFNGQRILQNGVYSATYAAANGCDSVATLSLVVVPSPEVQLDFTEKKDFCIGDSLLVKASGAEVYHWGNAVTGQGDAWRWPLLDRMNTLTVIGVSGNQCKDTARLAITAAACCHINMPNAFSPNGDGINDQFGPVTNGHFKNYTLSIYDRWGRRIFTGHTENKQWDGMSGAVPAETGTYHYIVTGYCMDDTPIRSKGDLVLIR